MEAGTAAPEIAELSDVQVSCLAALLDDPGRYTQRFVEHFGFLPDGGKNWMRTLQIRIPDSPIRGEAWWPVSLGPFPRKRYPDLTVLDAGGCRLTLLTREQHRNALARAILRRHVIALHAAAPRSQLVRDRLIKKSVRPYRELVSATTGLLAQAPAGGNTAYAYGVQVSSALRDYAKALRVSSAASQRIRFALGQRVRAEKENRRYLCWIRAKQGELVTIRVCYSAHDEIGQPLTGEGATSKTIGARLMHLFQKFGFAPLSYTIEAPAHNCANSYYFTIAPPARTKVVALISDVSGDHSDDGDIDCAHPSFHIHSERDSPRARGLFLRPYLMPERREHLIIATGALLNILVVFLASWGRLITGSSVQAWAIITPTVVVGYIARQQRHYYAYATRLQTAVLWIYLVIGALFIVVTTFSNSHVYGVWGWKAKLLFLTFATLNAFVAVTYASIGPMFRSVTYQGTRWLTWFAQWLRWRRIAREKRDPRPKLSETRCWVGPKAARRYEVSVLAYCLVVFCVGIVWAGAVCAGGVWMWKEGKVRGAKAPLTGVAGTQFPDSLRSLPLTAAARFRFTPPHPAPAPPPAQ